MQFFGVRDLLHSSKTAGLWLLAVLVLVTSNGCGGGGTGSTTGQSSSALGGSQDPDPVVVDFPIAYVQRPLLTDDGGELLATDVRRATDFFPGARLLVRDRASPSASAVDITAGLFPADPDGNAAQIDIKDLAVSFDGTQLVFALRAPEDPDLDEDEQPTWNLWLYTLADQSLSRIIQSDIVAEDGHDIAPAFLPDGRIVFASTRQRLAKAVLLDEGKPQFSALDEDRDEEALVLHVVNADGSDIKQITFNPSGDFDPAVMSDGRIVYSRRDNVAGRDRISLYAANPDGTEGGVLYGIHSHDTGPEGAAVEFVEPAEMPDGRMLVMLRSPGDQQRLGAYPVAIDTAAYVDHDQPTFQNAGLLSDAQEVLISGNLTLDDDEIPLQGRYAYVKPLFDGTGRLLVSWSQCRLRDTTSDPADPRIVPCTDENLANADMVEADPLYGIWMRDTVEDTQQPVVLGESGLAFSEAVILESRVNPPVILDKTPGVDIDADLFAESAGTLHIRSVYDLDGTATADLSVLSDPAQSTGNDRPIRFLRLVKSVAMPDDDIIDINGTAFGRSQAQLMREILGYAVVEPDGSVKVKVPANVPFWIDLLDANGRRVGVRHNNWMQVRPGEEMECVGCHTGTSELPHGRLDAQAPSINAGAAVDGSPFPNTEPALFANTGESMAEVYTRINGVPAPNLDVVYDDVWTDPNVRAKDVSLAYRYVDLTTQPPTDPGCVTNWNATCRITINYPEHIQPLWEVDRRVFDVDGVTLLADNTCVSCHNVVDAAGMAMVPAGQIDLTGVASPDQADHVTSYRELLFNDNEQEVIDGALQDRLVQATDGNGNLLFELDENGDQVLDDAGLPIPILVTVGFTRPMSVAGAASSPRFFDLFAPGASHAGRMTEAELKLVSEWIDIGGQYYNNPFAVPQ